MDNRTVIVSVVNDFQIYDRFFRTSPNVVGCELFPFDNRTRNETIPVLYNRFIDVFDYTNPGWIVFAHQDFEFLESLREWAARLDPNIIYGPHGARTQRRFFGLYYQWRLSGLIIMANRDGSNQFAMGHPTPLGELTETFDCCCLFVHSDWLQRTGYRFDENLSFDLYGEDLSIAAREYHQTPSCIVPIPARHYAFHPVPPRYKEQWRYLCQKYKHCCYTSTCSHYIGTPSRLLYYQVCLKQRVRPLFDWFNNTLLYRCCWGTFKNHKHKG